MIDVATQGVVKSIPLADRPAQLPPGVTVRKSYPIFAVDALGHRFGRRPVLNGVSFSIKPGEFTVLLGPNGAGKTTLFSLATRLYTQGEGTIHIFDMDLCRHPLKCLQLMGVVFQQPTLDLDLTVEQNLFYHCALHGLSHRDAAERVAIELERVELLERRRDKVRLLSGGQRRRVEIARALLHRPRLLLLDEPTVGLDMSSRQFLLDHVRHLCREEGLAALWSTHLIDEAGEGARVIILDRGEVRADGSIPSILAENSCDLLAYRVRNSGRRALRAMRPIQYLRCLIGISIREWLRFRNQRGRFFSALVRPLAWLAIFATGFRSALGIPIIPPYDTHISYSTYIAPALLAMVLMFNGMLSSLSMVYDREMGSMRVLMVSPLPRWFLLTAKLLAGAIVSILQAYAFLVIAMIWGIKPPWYGYIVVLPALLLSGLMLGSLGLLLSSAIRHLENFASVMNFVIFPMFFASSALHPLLNVKEASPLLYHICEVNPFTHAVELIRFALYGQLQPLSAAVLIASTIVFSALAVYGYDPAKGLMARRAKE